MSEKQRYTAPWVFGVLELPFGAAVGFLQVAVPRWLDQAHVPLSQIATISAAGFMPHAWKLFWAPVLDMGNYRRRWYAGMAVLTAGLLYWSSVFTDPVDHLQLYTLLLIAAQTTAATLSSAVDALMATSSDPDQRGRVGGFKMAGNVGGTAVLGVLPIWLVERFSTQVSGAVLLLVVLGSGLAIFWVHEHKLVGQFVGRGLKLGHALALNVKAFASDLWTLTKSREGWTGLVICAAPIGSASLLNLFSAMAGDFHASDRVVELVNGVGGGAASALGSIVGGYVADRINRRLAYCLSGALTAVCAIAMVLAPTNAVTYSWGVITYSFAGGAAFAAFAGLVLEMVSHGAAVATKYALFVAVSNQAISYVTYLDGQASDYHHWGAIGAIGFDAVLSGIGIIVVFLMVTLLRRRRPLLAAAVG